MKIALFGYCKNGKEVARYLPKKNLSIFVFESHYMNMAKDDGYLNVELLEELNDSELKKIKIEDFDFAVCMLEDEAQNLFLALSIKTLSKDIKIVAKVEDEEYEHRYKLAGVDKIINPYKISSNHINNILNKPISLDIITQILFKDNSLVFDEITVLEGSFLDSKFIKDITYELKKEYNLIVLGMLDIERSDEFEFITKGHNHKIDKDDILVVLGDKDEIERIKNDLKESKKWIN